MDRYATESSGDWVPEGIVSKPRDATQPSTLLNSTARWLIEKQASMIDQDHCDRSADIVLDDLKNELHYYDAFIIACYSVR